jgi:flagellar motor switch protein FliG
MVMSKDDTIQIDGAAVAARILGKMPASDRKRIVESIRVLNPESAVKIETIILAQALPAITKKTSSSAKASIPAKKPTRPISEVTAISDRDLQDLLREVPQHDVVLALKNAAPEVQEKILSNLSGTRAAQVETELRELPSVQVEQVEAAQARIMRKADDIYSEESPNPAPRRLRSRLA